MDFNPLKMFLLILAMNSVLSLAKAADTDGPIRIDAPELAKIDFTRTDGGLEPVAGLKTVVIFRADKERPDLSDGRGWTYHHHPDLVCWKGRLYAAWSSCERDEDTGISRELYRTSADGEQWSPLAELFPPGVSTPLRMYFFHAPNGRMLAISGLRTDREKTDERTKGPLVVREIKADHTLGDVFTLRKPAEVTGVGEAVALPPPDLQNGTGVQLPSQRNNVQLPSQRNNVQLPSQRNNVQLPSQRNNVQLPSQQDNQPPMFDTAKDRDFVEACRQLLADHVFLEQQDYGVLLPPGERIKWHDPEAWTGDANVKKNATEFGRAMCFFRRADGALVAVGKKSWMSISHDNGQTWEQPVKSQSLVTGMGKVWGQRLRDDLYVLVYDPHVKIRFPLVLLTSRDGVTFSGPARVIHGELPTTHYPGKNKSPGASYIRGLSTWSDDGSRGQDAIWLLYSVNKEEIWLSRVPLSIFSGG
jgi:hypothetical protein